MISRGEIKKCGFKPIEDHKAEFRSYERKIPGAHARLEHKNEETGEIQIIIMADEANTTMWTRTVFDGVIPQRYELQIILRCLQIA